MRKLQHRENRRTIFRFLFVLAFVAGVLMLLRRSPSSTPSSSLPPTASKTSLQNNNNNKNNGGAKALSSEDADGPIDNHLQSGNEEGGLTAASSLAGGESHNANQQQRNDEGEQQALSQVRRADVEPTEPQYDLNCITDPVWELAAIPSEFRQLHHGIYKVVSHLKGGDAARTAQGRLCPDTITFAFKTECRPASKWHGQQGLAEVGVHHLTQLVYKTQIHDDRILLQQQQQEQQQQQGPRRRARPRTEGIQFATAPLAKGVIVRVLRSTFDNFVHRDHCGAILEHERAAFLARVPPHHLHEHRARDVFEKEDFVWMIGVALTWMPRHDDNALPQPSIIHHFLVPASSSLDVRSRNHAPLPLPPVTREMVNQMSDVFAMDYLLINEDREEKNWFYNKKREFIMMDNGWAFAGRNYEGSLCGAEGAMLQCPPLFRKFLSGTTERCAAAPIHVSRSIERIQELHDQQQTAAESYNVVDSLLQRRAPADQSAAVWQRDKRLKQFPYRLAAGGEQQGVVAFCRFRYETYLHVRAAATQWPIHNVTASSSSSSSLRSQWLALVRDDIMTTYFLRRYGTDNFDKSKTKKASTTMLSKSNEKVYNQGLARYVHGCPLVTKQMKRWEQRQEKQQQQEGEQQDARHDPDRAQNEEEQFQKETEEALLQSLADGIGLRLQLLSWWMSRCVEDLGEDYVFG